MGQRGALSLEMGALSTDCDLVDLLEMGLQAPSLDVLDLTERALVLVAEVGGLEVSLHMLLSLELLIALFALMEFDVVEVKLLLMAHQLTGLFERAGAEFTPEHKFGLDGRKFKLLLRDDVHVVYKTMKV